MAHTVADGEMLVRAAESSRAVLGVCFQNRYNDTARVLRELLGGGELGPVFGARASVTWFRDAAYYQRRDWRGRWATAGGGVLMNQAIHMLDLLQWLLGPVADVQGTVATLRAAGGHRSRGHGRAADAAPHDSRRHGELDPLRHQRTRRERTRRHRDPHREGPRPAVHRSHRQPHRRPRRHLRPGHAGNRREGVLGRVARPADRRLLPARPHRENTSAYSTHPPPSRACA